MTDWKINKKIEIGLIISALLVTENVEEVVNLLVDEIQREIKQFADEIACRQDVDCYCGEDNIEELLQKRGIDND